MGVDHIIYAVPTNSLLFRDVQSGLPVEKIEMLYSMGYKLKQAAEGLGRQPHARDHELAWLEDMVRYRHR